MSRCSMILSLAAASMEALAIFTDTNLSTRSFGLPDDAATALGIITGIAGFAEFYFFQCKMAEQECHRVCCGNDDSEDNHQEPLLLNIEEEQQETSSSFHHVIFDPTASPIITSSSNNIQDATDTEAISASNPWTRLTTCFQCVRLSLAYIFPYIAFFSNLIAFYFNHAILCEYAQQLHEYFSGNALDKSREILSPPWWADVIGGILFLSIFHPYDLGVEISETVEQIKGKENNAQKPSSPHVCILEKAPNCYKTGLIKSAPIHQIYARILPQFLFFSPYFLLEDCPLGAGLTILGLNLALMIPNCIALKHYIMNRERRILIDHIYQPDTKPDYDTSPHFRSWENIAGGLVYGFDIALSLQRFFKVFLDLHGVENLALTAAGALFPAIIFYLSLSAEIREIREEYISRQNTPHPNQTKRVSQ